MFQGNLIQASIGEAINQGSISSKAINPDPIVGKAIKRGSILEQINNSKSYCGEAINKVYWSLPNNRLKLTAPSVHAFCFAAGAEDPGPRGEKACPSARSLSVALDGLCW